MTDSMIERVADRIWAYHALGTAERAEVLEIARAAIEAMRQPSQQMIAAADSSMIASTNKYFGGTYSLTAHAMGASVCFAMIETALKD